ncbi:PG0541 family transporter-associated protein [Marispirochaeta sp.]|jgi:hypothetical protein|uniref:PG0541 family transporter-associated protein n=1 Tax=Marispirochaeta sp. TaxID=2038653 RepID=UPI0029C7441A|nr:PG0541 family transporter-associated protein [Marispirochaeta sp.]
MKRIEIIANRSIEGDLHDALKEAGAARHYTKIPLVHGVGSSGPRMGDHIWPEENFILLVYCDNEEAAKIRSVIEDIKGFFKEEGIKLFEMECG